MRLTDERDGLGPRQRGPLAIAVERRLAPGVEDVDPLFRLSCRAGVDRVHVEAIRAAVDLRGADLDELQQRVFQAGALRELVQSEHRAIAFG